MCLACASTYEHVREDRDIRNGNTKWEIENLVKTVEKIFSVPFLDADW